MTLDQDSPILVWDIIYLVLDACVISELDKAERLLEQIGRHDCWVGQLLLANSRCRDYLLRSHSFHQLRLWRVLGKTVRHHESVVIAVEHKNDWTLLDVKLSSQPTGEHPQWTKCACIINLVECRPPRRTRMQMLLDTNGSVTSNSRGSDWVREGLVFRRKHQIVPIFSYEDCLLSGVQTFASRNRASIWIWRSPSNAWLYRHIGTYRLILDHPEKELLVWNASRQPFERLSVDEAVLHHNVELFANLAQYRP
ncbi:hypothetical protein BX666DRAFT_1874986 [Dichotomocladium elegans]|nr:hypothetical protein BX666DRAFT_1874986 [Dichotomocladium elegans]